MFTLDEFPSLSLQRVVGGLDDLQSWTSRETFGLERMLVVFREEGFVVMTMTGNVL